MNQTALVNNLRTFLLLAALTALITGLGAVIGGRQGLVLALGFALAMNFFSYWFSDKIALRMSGAREVSENDAPQLHAMVAHLAQRAGLPRPRVAIIDDPSPNAFATGRDPRHGVVAVTSGIQSMLTREELEGVIAHELAHIKHRDILIGSIAAVLAGAISSLAHMLQFGLFFGGGDDEENPLGIVGLLATIFLAPMAAMLIQMAVSRSREFEADRGGAAICGRPLALAGALQKLERGAQMNPMPVNPATAHMYIVNPMQRLRGLFNFSTHPATAERVARLEALAREQSLPAYAPGRPVAWS